MLWWRITEEMDEITIGVEVLNKWELCLTFN